MSYALKYFWNYELPEQSIRLEIYKKDSLAAPMEIGNVVQGLQLTISGGEDNIDAPMLSTSLVMTFADAYDHPDSESLKCGNWAEFYTPDATLWKVILLGKSSAESSYREIWGGYVTPDSYEEELSYGGSVTIVARDNIGHLNDFTFDAKGDAEGMISFRELVEAAWAKIESPMSLIWSDTWLQTEGVDAPDTYLYAPAFEGDSWHKAVEDVLFSYGAVMRYCGSSKVMICPLAYLPYSGEDQDKTLNPTFVAGATRLLTPAVKRIEESVEYDVSNILAKLVKAEDFDGTSIEVPDSSGSTGTANPLKAKEKGTGWINPASESAIYFSPASYDTIDENVAFTDEEKANLPSSMMLLCNSKNGAAIYSRYVNACDNLQYELRFGGRYYKASATKLGKYNQDYCKIDKFVYSLRYTESGVTEYLQSNGEWDAAAATLEISADNNSLSSVSIPVSLPFNKKGLLELIIKRIEIRETLSHGYVVVEALVLSVNENTAYLKKNSVNTIYDDKNNVILQREPRFAPTFNAVAFAGLIKNGIYAKVGEQFRPTPKWAWPGSSAQQMSVYIHLQQICYYAKPNNILEGTIVNGDVTSFGEVWQWENKKHLFVAGQFNFLTGHIDSAILREYLTYEEMWSNVPETQLPSVDSASMNTIQNEASSGSSNANTYSNTTTVNIGQGGGGSGASYLNDLLDVNTQDIISGSVLYFNGSEWVDRSLAVWLEDLLEKSSYLASLWKIDPLTGEIYTDKKVHIKGDIYADGEVSAGGVGEEGEDESDLTEVFRRLGIVEDDIAEIQSVLEGIEGNIATQILNKADRSELANYLPLSGGTISNDYEEAPLKIATTAYEWVALRLKTKTSAIGGSLVYGGGSEWKVTDDGWNQSYALLHEGNFTNYALSKSGTAADSDKLKGKGAWEYFQRYGTIRSQSDMDALDKARCGVYQINHYSPVEGAYDYGQLLNFHDIAGVAQIYFADYNRGVYVRYNWQGYSQDVGSWKRLAYTTDNVASADKSTRYIPQYISGTSIADAELNRFFESGSGAQTDLPASVSFLSGFTICADGNASYKMQLGINERGRVFTRSSEGSDVYKDWREVAFLDSNVASADMAWSLRSLGFMTDLNIQTKNGLYKYNGEALNRPNNFGLLLQLSNKDNPLATDGSSWIYQMAYDTTAVRIMVRQSTNGSAWSNWKTLAFTDSNVASATKLATSRKIWGQSFDGSADISGALYMPNGADIAYRDTNDKILAILGVTPANQLAIGYGMADNNYTTILYGGTIRLQHRTNVIGFILNSSGNVGIGTSDPEYKLDVNGDARVRGCLSFSGITTLNTPIIKFAGGEYFDIYGNLVFAKNSGSWSIFDQSTDNTLFRIYRASGNVGIGNPDPAYKLDVNGAIHSQTGYYVGSSLFAWYDNGTWLRDAATLNLNAGSALKMHISYVEKLAISDSLVDIKTNAKVGGGLSLSGAITGVSYIAMDGYIGGLTYINDNATNGFMFGSRSAVGSEGGALIYTYGNTPISMYTGGWERMLISPSGDVSIYKNLNLAETAYINGEIYLGNDAEGIFYYKSIPRFCYHNQGTWVSNLMTFEHNRVTIHQHLSLANALYVDTSGNGFVMAGTDYYSYIARTEDGQWKEDIFNFYPNGDNYAFGKFIFAQLIRAEQGIKIGDATITWDAEANALKIDGNVYATGEVAAGGIAN